MYLLLLSLFCYFIESDNQESIMSPLDIDLFILSEFIDYVLAL